MKPANNQPNIHDLAFRLSSLGAKPHTIAAALGITINELKSLPEYNKALADTIRVGKLRGVEDTLDNLNKVAARGNVQAILALLAIHDPDYNVQKATVEVNTNVSTLPTAIEARRIIEADPALSIEGTTSSEGATTNVRS